MTVRIHSAGDPAAYAAGLLALLAAAGLPKLAAGLADSAAPAAAGGRAVPLTDASPKEGDVRL